MREPTEHEVAVLSALSEVARPIILTRFTLTSCIASTRIALDVMAYFNIQGQELPLYMMIFNPDAAAMIREGKTLDEVHDAALAIAPDVEGGPWTLAVGADYSTDGSTEGWSGHLVAAIPAAGVYLDLSADQATRELKNIHTPPYWMRIPDEDWWAGTNPVATLVNDQGTTMVLDRRARDPLGYKRSPNWRRTSTNPDLRDAFKDLTGQIIREVRARL